MTSVKKKPLPYWLSFSLAELKCLLNILMPLPTPTLAFRLRWFWRRRLYRLRAIASRYGIAASTLIELSLPP